MILKEQEPEIKEVTGRIWRFAACEFNESSRELLVHGRAVEIESKPLDVLYQLLAHAGEVVTRDELFDTIWPGTAVVEGSLATAISKLRKALGDEAQATILTVHRAGYRLGVPVQSRRIAAPAFRELLLNPHDPVPGREQWRLITRMDISAASEVWLAEQPKTHETRIFKFAADGIRLKGLKREATVSRFLKESLGERYDFVRVLEWNFDAPPFYLESEFAGRNLEEWAENEGGLAAVSFANRLQILLRVAKAVSAAHGVGVLHKDLKPGNILVERSARSGPEANGENDIVVRVADFGSASLTDPARLNALGITNLGFTQTEGADVQAFTGTMMYLAPEVLAGHSPTASADIYALGVLLYQLAVADFRRQLSPGWEAQIEDPLIREDIADAACGDPERRLASAAILVRRIETLEQRRAEVAQQEWARRRAELAEARIARARTRRPWLIAAILALATGFSASLFLYRRASVERDRANHQTAIADSVSRFLTGDLLGRGNPFETGKSDESLIEAVKQASPNIDIQFRNAPEVAARLHQAIARALDNRTAYADARPEYVRAAALFEKAAALFEKAGSPLSQAAIVVQLQRAAAEARSYESGSLPRAKAILARQEFRLAGMPKTEPDMLVWLANARGMIALIDNKIREARDRFAEAWERSASVPAFDERARLVFKQRLAFTWIRLGDGARAEQLFRELIAAFSRTDGAGSPNVLRVRLNLAQAFMVGQKHKEAIAETTSIYPSYVAKLGADHELSMQVLTTRAESEGALGLWDDAIRDDLKVHGVAERKQGPASFFSIASLSDAALAQCRSGRVKEGSANAREAYQASAKAFGARAGLSGGAAHTLASCLIESGHLDEASSLLQGIDTDAVAQLAGSRNWSANVDLAEAEIAYRRGDYAQARKHLVAARSLLSDTQTEPYQKQLLDRLAARLGTGRPSDPRP